MGMQLQHRSDVRPRLITIGKLVYQQDGATSAHTLIRADVHDYLRHLSLIDSLSVSCPFDTNNHTCINICTIPTRVTFGLL